MVNPGLLAGETRRRRRKQITCFLTGSTPTCVTLLDILCVVQRCGPSHVSQGSYTPWFTQFQCLFHEESLLIHDHIEGSWPEWCISSMIYSRDTPFWSETLDIGLYNSSKLKYVRSEVKHLSSAPSNLFQFSR